MLSKGSREFVRVLFYWLMSGLVCGVLVWFLLSLFSFVDGLMPVLVLELVLKVWF